MKPRIIIAFAWLVLVWHHDAGAQYQLQEAFPGLTFELPVDLQHAGDASGRIFVVEQPGRIQLIKKSGGTASSQLFLDITGRVASGGEMGLLGLAFHPDFVHTGFFYVDYTRSNPRQTVISRFALSSEADRADPQSEQILLTIDQPYTNHNGGQIAFGPDGYLYIALGDGGSGGDPQNNAQNPGSLLGKILRIDVNAAQGELAYAIPPDNPFAANMEGFREEIFAWGLRNPWRFSFDSEGRLWCADVGQNKWEEINIIRKGGNYGWRIMEGLHCYSPASGCDTSGLELPLYEYGHDSAGGYSITGGHVYAGLSLPELRGRYIFADFVSQRIWSLQYDSPGTQDPAVTELTKAPAGISAFGVDEDLEIYLCAFDGKIYTIRLATSGIGEKESLPAEFHLLQNYPNPFNAGTKIRYAVQQTSRIALYVHTLTGQRIKTLQDQTREPGLYETSWDANDENGAAMASGVYLVSLRSPHASRTSKILLLK